MEHSFYISFYILHIYFNLHNGILKGLCYHHLKVVKLGLRKVKQFAKIWLLPRGSACIKMLQARCYFLDDERSKRLNTS